MNEFFPQLANKAKQESGLTPAEKSAMLARIREEMEAYPVQPRIVFPAPIRSPFEFLLLRGVLVPLILCCIFVGGLSAYAAEDAVPGDLLYPIKIGVTEPVREVLAFSAEAKAAWHAEAVERRMREAETLALRGELTESHTAEIEARFDQHASMVEIFLRAVESNSPLAAAEISARFAGTLAAYGSNILQTGLKSVDAVTRRESDSFAQHIKVRQSRLVSPPNSGTTSAPARAKKKPSAAVPLHDPISTARAVLSSVPQANTIAVLKDLEGQVLSSLGRTENEFRSLKPVINTDASVQAAKRAADIRNLLATVEVSEESDEKKKAAARERLELALKHAIGLEAFLEGQKAHATSSASTVNSSDKGDEKKEPKSEQGTPPQSYSAPVPIELIPTPSIPGF